MLKACFQGDFEETDLYVEIISADNEKQSGDYFKAFIQLMNKNKEKIGRLAIIDTSFLHRHYDPKYANETKETDWYAKNKKHLEDLQFPYLYLSYSDITKTAFYKAYYKQVKLDYSGDEKGHFVDQNFRSIIKRLSNDFLEKGTLKQVIKFILDETAGYPALIQHLSEWLIKTKQQELNEQFPHQQGMRVDPQKLRLTTSYPGGFNDAIKHSMLTHKPKFPVHTKEQSYRFRGSAGLKLFSSTSTRQTLPAHTTGMENTAYSGTQDFLGYKISPFALNIAYFVDQYRFSGSLQPIVCMKVIEACEKIKKEALQTHEPSNYTL